ncbi:unnamed protein product [Trypanosoma congolense IL3000]|uniref:WGS project CAEQ00000000 data, annotated contig 2213 n=1 Tax=Trypanosoma congolense (strain IL3000) TaxID=1068625 RepID=F9WCC5_TRYCI|nr:unnamed protein product [Trypanosoma congolense IL3000]
MFYGRLLQCNRHSLYLHIYPTYHHYSKRTHGFACCCSHSTFLPVFFCLFLLLLWWWWLTFPLFLFYPLPVLERFPPSFLALLLLLFACFSLSALFSCVYFFSIPREVSFHSFRPVTYVCKRRQRTELVNIIVCFYFYIYYYHRCHHHHYVCFT